MNKFDEMYEKAIQGPRTLDLVRKLDKKPLTMISSGKEIKVFGYSKGEYKELFSVLGDSTGHVKARNFVYKNSAVNYYMDGNKRVDIPHYDER